MSRRLWIVFGALAGASLFAGGAFFVTWDLRNLFHSSYTPAPWGAYAMMVGAPAGIVVGGLLGSRAPEMTHVARFALAGLEGAVLLATVGGVTTVLFGSWASANGSYDHGMRDFVLGATAGAIGGLILGGLLGSRPSSGLRSRRPDRPAAPDSARGQRTR